MDRRGLALPAGAAASDFDTHPTTLKKGIGVDLILAVKEKRLFLL
jgi:hypothetical protein